MHPQADNRLYVYTQVVDYYTENTKVLDYTEKTKVVDYAENTKAVDYTANTKVVNCTKDTADLDKWPCSSCASTAADGVGVPKPN